MKREGDGRFMNSLYIQLSLACTKHTRPPIPAKEMNSNRKLALTLLHLRPRWRQLKVTRKNARKKWKVAMKMYLQLNTRDRTWRRQRVLQNHARGKKSVTMMTWRWGRVTARSRIPNQTTTNSTGCLNSTATKSSCTPIWTSLTSPSTSAMRACTLRPQKMLTTAN